MGYNKYISVMSDKNLKSKSSPKHSEVAQVGRFGLVGVLNTLIDFSVLNILIRTTLPQNEEFFSIFGLAITGLIIAGVISGTLAMINSFIFNQRFTFKSKNVGISGIVMFFVVTTFGLYAIRPPILSFFTQSWQWPSSVAYSIGQALYLPMDQAFYTANVALAGAVAIVFVYNYLAYKYLVFKR